MKYNGIKNVNSGFKKTKTIKRKRLHFFSLFAIILLLSSCYNLGFVNWQKLQIFIKTITNNWTPKPDDFGKIKFVNFSFSNNKNSDGVFIVSRPFKNYYATNINETFLEVSGLGDVVVISPIDGIVQDIIFEENKYKILLASNNVIVGLYGIDYACINVGSKVKTGEKIAISLNSKIGFNILCSGAYIALPAAGANDTFFE